MAIQADTGQLISTTFTNYTMYKYSQHADKQSRLLTWIEGFDEVCLDPYNNFGFARVTLTTAQAQLLTCIQHNVTVHMDEWIGAFSRDDSVYATGSGDAEAEAQLLLFDTAKGQAVINTNLAGLAAALGAAEGLFDIWSVNFT